MKNNKKSQIENIESEIQVNEFWGQIDSRYQEKVVELKKELRVKKIESIIE